MSKNNSNFGCLLFIVMMVLAIPAYVLVVPAFGTSYSKGVREGQLQKYSVKGLIWKTGEGELILPNFRINTTEVGSKGGYEVFEFSDKECRNFSEYVGKNVMVYYSEAFHRPKCDGSTRYQVDSIVIR